MAVRKLKIICRAHIIVLVNSSGSDCLFRTCQRGGLHGGEAGASGVCWGRWPIVGRESRGGRVRGPPGRALSERDELNPSPMA